MSNANRNHWIKLPGLFLRDEIERGGVPMDPLFEYLIVPDRRDEAHQPLLAIYFRSRRIDRESN